MPEISERAEQRRNSNKEINSPTIRRWGWKKWINSIKKYLLFNFY